jgi:hypothetical protein
VKTSSCTKQQCTKYHPSASSQMHKNSHSTGKAATFLPEAAASYSDPLASHTVTLDSRAHASHVLANVCGMLPGCSPTRVLTSHTCSLHWITRHKIARIHITVASNCPPVFSPLGPTLAPSLWSLCSAPRDPQALV